jgi:hypothetical protein
MNQLSRTKAILTDTIGIRLELSWTTRKRVFMAGSNRGKREVRERLVTGNTVDFREAAVRDRQLSLLMERFA